MSAVSPAVRVLSSALSLLFFRQREAAVTQVSVEWNGAAPSFFSLKLMAAGVTNVCVFGGGWVWARAGQADDDPTTP